MIRHESIRNQIYVCVGVEGESQQYVSRTIWSLCVFGCVLIRRAEFKDARERAGCTYIAGNNRASLLYGERTANRRCERASVNIWHTRLAFKAVRTGGRRVKCDMYKQQDIAGEEDHKQKPTLAMLT